jgi:hypothetical protein
MDGAMKFIQPQFVIDVTPGIGWPADSASLGVDPRIKALIPLRQ